MKRLVFLLFLSILFLSFIGCIETQIELEFNGDNTYNSTVSFTADKIMAGDELNIYTWQIEYIFPEILSKYKHTVETFSRDYSDYIQHRFSAERLNISKPPKKSYIKFVKKTDGKFLFESKIPKLLNEVSEETKDDVVIVIKIIMPKPIDMANTTLVEGNVATWSLTKTVFTTGTTLKAVTK